MRLSRRVLALAVSGLFAVAAVVAVTATANASTSSRFPAAPAGGWYMFCTPIRDGSVGAFCTPVDSRGRPDEGQPWTYPQPTSAPRPPVTAPPPVTTTVPSPLPTVQPPVEPTRAPAQTTTPPPPPTAPA